MFFELIVTQSFIKEESTIIQSGTVSLACVSVFPFGSTIGGLSQLPQEVNVMHTNNKIK